jgi:hypothetical protein
VLETVQAVAAQRRIAELRISPVELVVRSDDRPGSVSASELRRWLLEHELAVQRDGALAIDSRER